MMIEIDYDYDHDDECCRFQLIGFSVPCYPLKTRKVHEKTRRGIRIVFEPPLRALCMLPYALRRFYMYFLTSSVKAGTTSNRSATTP